MSVERDGVTDPNPAPIPREANPRKPLSDDAVAVLLRAANVLSDDGWPWLNEDWSDDLGTRLREIALTGETFEEALDRITRLRAASPADASASKDGAS